MFIKLLILFTVVPVLELYVLFKAGQHIGAVYTIAIVIMTGIAGAAYAKQQGVQIIAQVKTTINQGQMPGRELVEGVMVLAGGIMLLTPGFITDFTGFSLLIPFTRNFFTELALSYFKNKVQMGAWQKPSNFNSYNYQEDDVEIQHPEIDD